MAANRDIRSFGMRNLQVLHEIETIEREHGLRILTHGGTERERDDQYFARFDQSVRRHAQSMASHYEVFYCLENTIRDLISDVMEGAFGTDWWQVKVDQAVRDEAKRNKKAEEEMGVAPRSDRQIDYITFGQLSLIIEQQWDVFAGVLHNRQAVNRILRSLNTLRAPIAHCTPLPENESVRLRLAVQDWFRQVE